MKSMTKTRGCGCTSKTGCNCGKSNCGCGGKAGCTCNGATATGTDIATVCAPCDEAAFVRPQFFAGQLLTEDDLTALETYVVGKNRLHNAKLFGDGVVCGLEVSCGPCDGTTVRVAPGYALDCCGNDLVLTCDREIDLKPLIIALREQKHGKGNCGSPCDDKQTDTKKPTVVEYCLYLRYTESASDPIANYPSADDCAVSCQPTRLREGVAFELRCPEDPVRDDIVTHLEACLGRLSAPDRVTSEGRAFDVHAAQTERALQLMDKPLERIELSEQSRWQARLTDLDHIASQAQSHYDPSGRDLVAWTEILVDIGGLFLRMRATQSAPQLGNADTAIEFMLSKLGAEDQRNKIDSQLDRMVAGAAVVKHRTVANDFSPKNNFTYSDLLYLRGALLTSPLRNAFIHTAHDLRSKLLQALGCDGGNTSDCTLYDDLREVSIPSSQSEQHEVEASDAAELETYGRKLGGLVKRFFMDCICRAFNPPCRDCDDTAVLLACIKVRDCNVIEVCNLARTFVLSPTAMRYWLPPISWLGDVLEQLCCPSDACDEDVTKGGTDTKAHFIKEMLRAPSAQAAALALPAFYRSGAYLPSLVSATRSFGQLAARRLVPGPSRLHIPVVEKARRVFRPGDVNELDQLRSQVTELTARLDAYDAKKKGSKG